MSATTLALFDVLEERLRQERLKADGRFQFTLADLGEGSMTDAERLLCLAEETGEAIDEHAATRLASLLGRVSREVLTSDERRLARDTAGTPEALRAELIQVAAVAVAWVEAIDRRAPLDVTGDEPRTYLRITKWDDFQHYKAKALERPAWVKFYSSSLDSADLIELSIAGRLLANLLLLVAARTGNRMPNEPRTLAKLVHMPPQTVRKELTKLLEIRWIEAVNLTDREAELAAKGQLRLTESRPAPEPESRPRARGPALARTEAETEEELPSNATSTENSTRDPEPEPTALPGRSNLEGPNHETILGRILGLVCRDDENSRAVVTSVAEGQADHVLAQALESYLGRKPRPTNPAGYMVDTIRRIAAEHGKTTPSIDREPEVK